MVQRALALKPAMLMEPLTVMEELFIVVKPSLSVTVTVMVSLPL
jgi:hypothetical protein